MYFHPDVYTIKQYVNSNSNHADYRWTLDTEDDWLFIKEIYDELYNEDMLIKTDEVYALLKKNPALMLLNKHVEQKSVLPQKG